VVWWRRRRAEQTDAIKNVDSEYPAGPCRRRAGRGVRMRAADAAEKVTRRNREFLQPYKKELLGLMVEAKEQELRWHLEILK
jgi:hypothetical protein